MEQESSISTQTPAPAPTPGPTPAPAKQNKNTGLIVALIIVFCVFIGVAATLVILLIGNSADSNTEVAKETEKETSTRNILALNTKQDATRKDDIMRFLTAANDYQSNNSGNSPWRSGETDKNFVRRYIDVQCKGTGDGAPDDTCGKEFRDPDGKPYFFVYKGSLDENKSVSITQDHAIYVYTKAYCGKGDNGALIVANGVRQYAMLYKLSSGAIYCNDNH